MDHWLLELIDENRINAIKDAEKNVIFTQLSDYQVDVNEDEISKTINSLEIAIIDLYLNREISGKSDRLELIRACSDIFRLFRVLPLPQDSLEAGKFMLKACSYAVLGEKGPDAARWLNELRWPSLPVYSDNWKNRAWATIIDIWLRLIRKNGWADHDEVLQRVGVLRDAQIDFEKNYLTELGENEAQKAALELIGLYHLTKAAEVLALYITNGEVDGSYQIHQLLDMQFDRVLGLCSRYPMLELENLSQLLAAAAQQMADNSLWTVTRGQNTQIGEFVRSLVSKGRGNKAIFDVLPPQRETLFEKGLIGSSRRAIVVSLPTSSGKTLIAEFRILQALNQFERDKGWVAYLAPTRTLVNQITRRLRIDFKELDISVEQVSPALEIDSIEEDLFTDDVNPFRVLVTTPEKLDLMLRQGWEGKLGRPLTLVVVDEAHNIQDTHRGLRLELLLSTINNDYKNANFLLLTPFIDNAREVAQWLGGQNSQDISLSVDWQPNDRVIGIAKAMKGASINSRSHEYSINFETIHTTRQTLVTNEKIQFPGSEQIASTYVQANTSGNSLAAVTAQFLKGRGPVITMQARADWCWALAEKLKIEENKRQITKNVRLVQEFLELEYSPEFPLIELLSYGIGVHHAGLSDEVRELMEWLFEKGELDFLVATTTIAQGVNFPISGLVMAANYYVTPTPPYQTEMPPEDFWNIAGRAGRISQGSLGVIALIARDDDKAEELKRFIGRQSGALNSALIQLAEKAQEDLSDLGRIVYNHPEWSSFVQYLAHSYRQMGQPDGFNYEIERIMRSTYGFSKLREINLELANNLLDGVYSYSLNLQKPRQPLKLVDSTGFSLESIKAVLSATNKYGITKDVWNKSTLFYSENGNLRDMMGILLRVPELRDNLRIAIGGDTPDGRTLSFIIKDWVNGLSITELAGKYFAKETSSNVEALTKCGQNLYGKLSQTAAWGLGALLSITGGGLNEDQMAVVRNLPSWVYYGVNSDEAITLRLLGVPRTAANEMASDFRGLLDQPISKTRDNLMKMGELEWDVQLGRERGRVYRNVWRVLQGLD